MPSQSVWIVEKANKKGKFVPDTILHPFKTREEACDFADKYYLNGDTAEYVCKWRISEYARVEKGE